jgi:hypothetical protein
MNNPCLARFREPPAPAVCYIEYQHTGYGRLAQLGEHGVRNAGVVGSNPMPSTIPKPPSVQCPAPGTGEHKQSQTYSDTST